MVRVGNLEAVANTLVRLSLVKQKLTSMSDLGRLPKLRELFLQENQLHGIDGLAGYQ